MAGVNAASAEPMLRNVAGFDVGLLAGKTCQGTNKASMPPRSTGEWRAAEAASAQPALRNVSGFDPALLAGKTCQDSFDTGAGRPESEGALQLRFAVNEAMLTASVCRRFGSNAQNSAAYAITRPGPPFGVGGFQNLGPVHDPTVTNNIIQYVDGPGDRVVLYYDAGWLWGQSGPRGEHTSI
jgi:hypothetical protein